MQYEKFKKKICIGVTEDNELVFINLEIGSCNNEHFTITHDTYEGVIEEERGEEEARERLEDSDYWDELGFLNKDCFLNNFIDFKEVADHVINNDGWQNTNGEYYEIGEHEGETFYINFSSCGASIDDLKKEYKKLLITEEDKKTLIESDELHLKNFDKYTEADHKLLKKVIEIKNKYDAKELNDCENLIPLLLEDD